MILSSGQHVCLFNRFRSQTNSTRFMSFTRSQLSAVPKTWEPFRIWNTSDFTQLEKTIIFDVTGLIQFKTTSNSKASLSREMIKYDQIVVLEHLKTGYCTAPLIVRRFTDSSTVVAGTEAQAVPQLQKVAFELAAIPGAYLCVCDDLISVFQSDVATSPSYDQTFLNFDFPSNHNLSDTSSPVLDDALDLLTFSPPIYSAGSQHSSNSEWDSSSVNFGAFVNPVSPPISEYCAWSLVVIGKLI
jgi:hypothetical protein